MKINLKCLNCGKDIEREPRLIKENNFCSISCSSFHYNRINQVEYKCPCCSKNFLRNAPNKDIPQFCDSKCKRRYLKKLGIFTPERVNVKNRDKAMEFVDRVIKRRGMADFKEMTLELLQHYEIVFGEPILAGDWSVQISLMWNRLQDWYYKILKQKEVLR